VVPKIDAAQFQAWQRAPVGLVAGSYTMPSGSWQLFVVVALSGPVTPVAESCTPRCT